MLLERSTVSRGKARLVMVSVTLGVLAGLAFGVVRPPAPSSPAQEAADLPATVAPDEQQGDPATAPTAAEPPVPAQAAAQEPTEVDIIAAHQAAADFATAYATYSFDDPPAATVERVRDYVTVELAADLARSSGAAAGRKELAERRQRATGAASTVHTGDVGAGYVDVLVVARQEVTWQGGAETRWPSYLVRVVPTDDGWRVAGLLR
jgi:hypothetical protein